jgi:pimeloyl-ACP methyl ester carboxylesterase
MPYIAHIYYEEAGAGHPVVLIHCPALSHVYWRPVMDLLAPHCRAVALDIRGHGRSGLGDCPWTFREIAADVALLTRQLGLKRPVLTGYSTGASIALQAVLDEPDLYGGVVAVSGFSECTTLYLRGKAALGLWGVRLGLSRYIGPSILGSNSTGKAHTQAMLPHVRQVSPAALRSCFAETLRRRITHRLSEIRVPVLLLYGGKDVRMHGYARILQQGLPRARLQFFPGVDHRVPTRRPAAFAAAVTAFVHEVSQTQGPDRP